MWVGGGWWGGTIRKKAGKWTVKNPNTYIICFLIIFSWPSNRCRIHLFHPSHFFQSCFIFFPSISLNLFSICLGTNSKHKKTTKQEFLQVYYCFFLLNNLIWTNRRGETKLYFLPIYWNKILHPENENILDEVLVF